MKKQIHITRHPLNMAVLILLMWTFIASLYAHNQFEAFKQWSNWAACVLLFYFLQQILTTPSRIYSILSALYVAGLIAALIGVCQHLFQIDFIPQSRPPAATFANRNLAAQFITLTFPLGIVLLAKRKKPHRILAVSGTVIMLVFLICIKTRAAWVSVLFELILITIILGIRSPSLHLSHTDFRIRNRSKLIQSLVVAVLVLAGLAVFFKTVTPNLNGFQLPFRSIPGNAVSESGFSSNKTLPDESPGKNFSSPKPLDTVLLRIEIWKNTIEMIKNRPLVRTWKPQDILSKISPNSCKRTAVW
ncbi:MAG: O-antigen ligase family protein [Thermodesulfobacteriota bacterium]|nr:O-antigen ligase family protein [Thermodesulfobacteriota bacterium]